MDKKLFGLLVANGALVTLAGSFSGVPLGFSVIDQVASGASGLVGDVRAWHMAHMEGLLNGMLMIAMAAAARQIAMSSGYAKAIFWGMVIAGWSNVIASNFSGLTGGRGMTMTGFDWNTFDFVVFMIGVAGALIGLIALTMAGFKAARE